MKTSCRVVVFLLVFGVAVCKDCLTANDHKTPDPNGKTGLYTGQQEFSLALLQAINQLNPDDNLFFSPYSTYHALLLGYFISSNVTEGYLKKVLRIDPSQEKSDVFTAYKVDKFTTQFRAGNSSYEFSNANRIYVDKEVQVRDCIPSLFVNELQTADFRGNPDESRKDINKWVEEQTRDMIKDLLPAGSIDQSTNLVLVNAAYFKGVWENKFKPEDTKPEVFHISPSKRTFVDMMYVEGSFNHDVSESLMAHILELPYQGGDISMYIFLPPFLQEDGVANILKRLTLERFRSVVEEHTLLPRTVQVHLPKFSLEHTLEMVPMSRQILTKILVNMRVSNFVNILKLNLRNKSTAAKRAKGNEITKKLYKKLLRWNTTEVARDLQPRNMTNFGMRRKPVIRDRKIDLEQYVDFIKGAPSISVPATHTFQIKYAAKDADVEAIEAGIDTLKNLNEKNGIPSFLAHINTYEELEKWKNLNQSFVYPENALEEKYNEAGVHTQRGKEGLKLMERVSAAKYFDKKYSTYAHNEKLIKTTIPFIKNAPLQNKISDDNQTKPTSFIIANSKISDDKQKKPTSFIIANSKISNDKQTKPITSIATNSILSNDSQTSAIGVKSNFLHPSLKLKGGKLEIPFVLDNPEARVSNILPKIPSDLPFNKPITSKPLYPTPKLPHKIANYNLQISTPPPEKAPEKKLALSFGLKNQFVTSSVLAEEYNPINDAKQIRVSSAFAQTNEKSSEIAKKQVSKEKRLTMCTSEVQSVPSYIPREKPDEIFFRNNFSKKLPIKSKGAQMHTLESSDSYKVKFPINSTFINKIKAPPAKMHVKRLVNKRSLKYPPKKQSSYSKLTNVEDIVIPRKLKIKKIPIPALITKQTAEQTVPVLEKSLKQLANTNTVPNEDKEIVALQKEGDNSACSLMVASKKEESSMELSEEQLPEKCEDKERSQNYGMNFLPLTKSIESLNNKLAISLAVIKNNFLFSTLPMYSAFVDWNKLLGPYKINNVENEQKRCEVMKRNAPDTPNCLSKASGYKYTCLPQVCPEDSIVENKVNFSDPELLFKLGPKTSTEQQPQNPLEKSNTKFSTYSMSGFMNWLTSSKPFSSSNSRHLYHTDTSLLYRSYSNGCGDPCKQVCDQEPNKKTKNILTHWTSRSTKEVPDRIDNLAFEEHGLTDPPKRRDPRKQRKECKKDECDCVNPKLDPTTQKILEVWTEKSMGLTHRGVIGGPRVDNIMIDVMKERMQRVTKKKEKKEKK